MMKTMLIRLAVLTLATALIQTATIAQKADPAEVQLKAAIQREVEDGDFKGAIEQYKKLANSSNRAVAAKALLRMGQCYEKLGDTESRKAYEHLVRDFVDQKDMAEQARARLAALGAPSVTRGRGPFSGRV